MKTALCIALLFLSGCTSIQAHILNDLEHKDSAERLAILERKNIEKLCSWFMSSNIQERTEVQINAILLQRDVSTCHGKFGAYRKIKESSDSPL